METNKLKYLGICLVGGLFAGKSKHKHTEPKAEPKALAQQPKTVGAIPVTQPKALAQEATTVDFNSYAGLPSTMRRFNQLSDEFCLRSGQRGLFNKMWRELQHLINLNPSEIDRAIDDLKPKNAQLEEEICNIVSEIDALKLQHSEIGSQVLEERMITGLKRIYNCECEEELAQRLQVEGKCYAHETNMDKPALDAVQRYLLDSKKDISATEKYSLEQKEKIQRYINLEDKKFMKQLELDRLKNIERLINQDPEQ